MLDQASLDLAVIGNCQVSALIDRDASIVWSCWPRPDSDPIFCGLMRPDGGAPGEGVLAIHLHDRQRSEQRYARNTAVVETHLEDAQGGEVRVTDFCPRFRTYGRLFRPAMLVRLIEPLGGRPVIRICVRPRVNYGADAPTLTTGSHHLRYVADGLTVRLTTDASIGALHEGRSFVLDRPLTLLLGPDERVDEKIDQLAQQWLAATREYWIDWVRTLSIPLDWQEAVIRAAITLKLCTYEDTGAVLAALTTSVPEAQDSQRNWDYRYCWLRDAFFVVQALNRLGATRTMEGFLRFIENVASHGRFDGVRPVYRITGSDSLAEWTAPGLRGYRGMAPVRVGNDAVGQTQHDVFGSIVLAAAQLFYDQRLSTRGDTALFNRLEVLGAQAVRAYGQPDAGPWELRTTARPHTFSAMMCWAACDRLAQIATHLGLPSRAGEWRAHAARMRENLLMRAWSPRANSFVSTLDGDDAIDATALLMPEFGLIDPSDRRFVATLSAVERDLVRDGCVLRYSRPDDFGTPKNAFTVCAFWYVNALSMVGRQAEAVRHFDRLLERRNHVGLLSEDIDPATGELWGNFPQTYSLVGIIRSALRLSRPWEAAL